MAPRTVTDCLHTLEMLLFFVDFTAEADPVTTKAEENFDTNRRGDGILPVVLHWGGDHVLGPFRLQADWIESVKQPDFHVLHNSA